MAIKKSELYSSLWKSCDELRGSMDASQYKDYVLVLLFMKYVSDKGGDLVDIPEGGSFKDMIKLKGQKDIGDKINKIIGALAKANDLNGIITVADFDDDEKLGKGKDKVDRLSNLIEIFENEGLDFSGNRAENDDILGDAYEYLMRHFATESGKSKGQFYTPAEVSRIMAKVIGINKSKSQSESVYDPTCGSGSLLLKAANESPHGLSIYGQENDNATRALAVMNMWLHGNPDSVIFQGNTLANPLFKDDTTGLLKTFDYAVANPPFSNKNWSNGLDAENDIYKRFEGFGIPPKKNGDYAFLLHFIKSLKSKGKGAIILPLGVLYRGNAEAGIRKSIIDRGYIKGIIGLPANLFYGATIAASIIIIDKEDAEHRKGVFMIDAGKGFIKDGNKNRLREQDIRKMVDVFNNQLIIPKYSRFVPLTEIKDNKNDYNLDIPRYIDNREKEDIQDIEAHLKGGIPRLDIEDLNNYWKVYPTLKTNLFKPNERPNFWDLNIAKDEIKSTIFNHPEFISFSKEMDKVFEKWQTKNTVYLKALEEACLPKKVIKEIAGDLIKTYNEKDLIDKYDIYQHLMDYWVETMQDDLYELTADGWEAGNVVTRIIKKTKKAGKETSKEVTGIEGLEGQLIPPSLIIQEYFQSEHTAIETLQIEQDTVVSEMDDLREENSGEDGLLTEAMDDKQKISKKNLDARIKELGKKDAENCDEWDKLAKYKKLMAKETKLKADIKKALAELEAKIIKQYPKLTIEEIKTLVVDKKWMATIKTIIKTELDAISHRLTERTKELASRYENPLPSLTIDISDLIKKVGEKTNKIHLIEETNKEDIQKTEAGVIPKDWLVKKLTEISHFENGKAHEQFIDEQGNFIVVNSKFVSTGGNIKKFSKKNIFPLKKGDIAIVMSDIPNGKALAKCFLIDKDNTYTLNQRIGGITPNIDIENRFLYYKLNRNKYYLAFDSGTGQTNIKRQEILDCPVALPSNKSEQIAVADTLSDMDNLIKELEIQLSKYKMIKTGMMQELLTGKKRLI